MKKSLITGIGGQDGSYLAELLLEKGYEVHGVIRKSDKESLWRIKSILDRVVIYEGDAGDEAFIKKTIKDGNFEEIYHLASVVDASVDFNKEPEIFRTNFWSSYYILRAIKELGVKSRVFIAGSSLMFGEVASSPQNEGTPMRPNTPYGIAKTAAYHFVRMYREVHGVFACVGILFNHESPRRDEYFLPRKITKAVAKIKLGRQDKLSLGDINAVRDWAYAGDVVEAMWLMLQREKAEDFVIGTGELHSITELLEAAFGFAGLNWKDYVVSDPGLIRKVDYANLCADIGKAEAELDWKPKVGFRELIERMVKNDLELESQNND